MNKPPVRDRDVFSPDDSFGIDDFNSEEDLPKVPARDAAEVQQPVENLEAPEGQAETGLSAPSAPPADRVISVGGEPASATALSLAELLENNSPVDWPEAVAIAQRICQAISRHPGAGAQEYLLDTRHVEITEAGEVLVLPGAPGGDPLVKQVGRILRALLEGGSAPVQLRLVASQAAFELPGFASVEELSQALRSFESPESDAIRTVFRRGREAKFIVPADHSSRREILPEPPRAAEPSSTWAGIDHEPARAISLRHISVAALSVVLTAAVAYLASMLWVRPTGQRESPAPLPVETTASSTAPLIDAPLRVETGAPVSAPAVASFVPPRSHQGADSPRRAESRTTPLSTTLTERGFPVNPPPPRDFTDAGADRVVFDSLVLGNPLYQLDPARSTPEAVALLRDSKRVLLPSIARRDYERAQELFEVGDHDRAISEANRVMKMLDDRDIGPLPDGLRDSVERLLSKATAARASEDDRVYTIADKSVIPPTALGRQLPETPPANLAHQLVGTLEMLINRQGEVEAVRLHTPLNRYHERMIVSAAKAWRYRPAVKNGKPVRFRLISSINLPES